MTTERKIARLKFEKVFTSQEFPEIELWKIARSVGNLELDGQFRQTSKTLSEASYWKEEMEAVVRLALRYREDVANPIADIKIR